MPLPNTRKLYEDDAFCTAFTATVLACEAGPGGPRAALDATAFYPEGGGQPFDTGTLGAAAVTAVHAEGGVVWHTLDTPLPVGSTVSGHIDWARRLDHMEQHTGEHILSGCLWRLYGAANVGFHIGEPAVRMDLDRPLTAAQLAAAEAEANARVRADTPVRCTVPDAAALAATEYRSKKALEGPVRLVEAGGDVCACCGTHLARTGQVGLIKILSAQPYKGGLRLRVACGQRALAAVAEAWADAEAAGRLASSAPGRLAPAVQALLAHGEEDRIRLAALQRQLLAALEGKAEPGRAQVLTAEGLDSREAAALAQRLAKRGGAFAAVLVPAPKGGALRYALAAAPAGAAAGAGPTDVRPLAAALDAAFAGRGGGGAAFCQGSAVLPDPKPQAAAARVQAFVRSWLQRPAAPNGKE